MEILLTAATTFEIQPTVSLLEKERYQLNGHPVEVLITGVGQVNTTYALTKKLHAKNFGLVIQAGIAGSFVQEIALKDTVLVKQDTFGDLGLEEKGQFTTLFDAGFGDRNHPPFTDGWLINNNALLATATLQQVRGITVNKVSDSLLQRRQSIQQFAPDVESMEGAALHYVCLQENISFLQIRSISNTAGERDKSKWVIKEAITSLNTALEKLMTQL